MISAKFQVIKNTSIYFQEKETSVLIENYYNQFLPAKQQKSPPFKTKKIDLKCGQTLQINIGDKTALKINVPALGQKSWKVMNVYSVSFKIDSKKYSGELIGYDDHLPPIAREFSCLKPLDAESQKMTGHEFIEIAR